MKEMNNREIKETCPLMQSQLGIFLECEKQEGIAIYNNPLLFKLSDDMDMDRLADAIGRTVHAHCGLFSAVVTNGDGTPVLQYRDQYAGQEICIRGKMTDEELEKSRASLVQPFDLRNERLFRVRLIETETSKYLFMDFHHIIFDGISLRILIEDIEKILSGGTIGQESFTAFDASEAEQELRGGDEWKKARDWNLAQFEKADTVSLPAGDLNEKEIRYGDLSFPLDISYGEIKEFCRKNSMTGSVLTTAAFGYLLSSVTMKREVVFSTIYKGRKDPRAKRTVSMFVTTLPVLCRIEDDMTVKDYLSVLKEQLSGSKANDLYSFAELAADTGINSDVQFVWHADLLTFPKEGPFKLIRREVPYIATGIPFSAELMAQDDSLTLRLTYHANRYSEEYIAGFAKCYSRVLKGLITQKKLSEVSLLSKEETQENLALSKGRELAYDREKTWLDLFLAHVKRTPDKTVVMDFRSSYTYAELDRVSDSVAAFLLDKGVEENNFVAVKMGRIKEFYATVTGIHKAGAAYVPIDPDYPEERISYMLEDSGAKVILTEEAVAGAVRDYTDDGIKGSRPVNLATPGHRAYMIYTSGSTGKPKGAIISHSSLMAFIAWTLADFHFDSDSVFAHQSSFSFDASMQDIFCPLAAGGQTHVFSEELRMDMAGMRDYINEHGIMAMDVSTQIGMAMVNQYPEMKLKYLLLGGEKLLPCAGTDITMVNAYGPTEFTVTSSYHVVDQDKDTGNIPIGRPVPNTWSLICDIYGNLLPRGMTGELCLAGSQMAEGYWNQEELTRERFVPCKPLNGTGFPVKAGETQLMYRTGDLARYNDEGELEYLGRIDTQVKLRGFRIEMGEIESTACSYEGVTQVAAEVKRDQLVLYYTSDIRIDENALKGFLAESLTEYMVPSMYIRLDRMPLTPNGKIDRRKLPEPETGSAAEYVEPANDAEDTVASTMRQVLGMENAVGALDDFFLLGGDSIKAIRLVSLLREKKYKVSVADIMKQKTVRGIAGKAIGAEDFAIDQNPYEGTVPESAIVAYFKDLHTPVPGHFNQTKLFSMKERADKELLKRAWDAVCCQHDILRAVFDGKKLNVRDFHARIGIEEYRTDSAALSSSDENGVITEICEEIQTHLEPEKNLVRIALIHGADTDLVYIATHHLVIDGVSWRILMSDMETAYSQAVKGEEIHLPAKTNTYRDYAEALHRYRDSFLLSLEIPYWKHVQGKLEALRTSEGKDYGRRFCHINVSMDPENTKQFTHANFGLLKADVNDALLTAVGLAVYKVTGMKDMSVLLEGHGREDLGEPLTTDRTVGWFTSLYPVVLEDLTGDISRDLPNIKDILHRIPNKGVGYNILRFIEGREQVTFSADHIPQIGFNYLGEMDAEQKGQDGDSAPFFVESSIPTGPDISPENTISPDLSFNCFILGGSFILSLDYNEASYNGQTARRIAEGILEQMKAISEYLLSCKEPAVTATDLGETGWSREEFERVMEDFASRGEKVRRIYPLLPMQEAMLLKHLSEPKAWAYRLVSIYEIDAAPDRDQLERALLRLSRKHEVLRTAIIHEGVSIPRQAVIDRKLSLETVDLSAQKNPEEAVFGIRERILEKGFDLQRKPLFGIVCARKDEVHSYLVVAVHHIIVDGWCIRLYMGDLVRYIREEMDGSQSPEMIPDPGRYETAVREILKKDLRAGLDYWRDLLHGYETRAEIPSFGSVPQKERSKQDEITTTLSVETTGKFEKICREAGATVSNGIELAWGLVLGAFCGTDDVVFGKIVSGRNNAGMDVDDVVGLFINSIPVRLKTDDNTTAKEALRILQEQSAKSNAYDYCHISQIQEQTYLGSNLLQTVLVFENYNSGRTEKSPELSLKTICAREERFTDILPVVYIREDRMSLQISFDTSVYTEARIRQILALFELFVEQISAGPDQRLGSFEYVTRKEKEELIALSKGKEIPYDREQTWLNLFFDIVDKMPSKTAVVDKNGSYTYEELDRASSSVAAYLLASGVKENSFVGVKMGRVKEFVAAVVGIHKAGAAYVPIDPGYPEERITYMLEDSGSKEVLTQEKVLELIAKYPDAKRVDRALPGNWAYMIYTSGSTGRPKGVVQSHRSLRCFLAWALVFPGLDADSVNGLHTSFSFDVSLHDLFGSLSAGGTLHVFSEELRKDLPGMRDYIEKNHITAMSMSTQIGMALINQYPEMNLRYCMIGGEKMLPCEKTGIMLINGYGPTEFTIFSNYHVVDQKRDTGNIPIGQAVPNTWSFVCDDRGRLMPRGMTGELCLAGPQIAEGYFNRPVLTAEKFVDCPYLPSEKMYRTGDLARYSEEGELLCLGRKDTQVKLRGFRIELGEIETASRRQKGIGKAAAEVRGDQLVLYYTSDTPVDEGAMKASLAGVLAEYMLPTVYVRLDDMPLTPNGKIDRRRLPDPVTGDREEVVLPATDTERMLCGIVGEVLNTDGLSVTADLVSLGLSSIGAMKLAAGISADPDIKVTVTDIMKNPTIREIAAQIDRSCMDLRVAGITAEEKRELYPITENQRGLLVDWQIDPQTTQYNIPFVRVFEDIDGQALLSAICAVVNAHSCMKARLEYVNDDVMIRRRDEDDPAVKLHELEKEPDRSFFQNMVVPFDLLHDRLYRIGIYTFGKRAWLFMDVHHIIFDGMSYAVFFKDLETVLNGGRIDPERITAFDHALFEEKLLKGDAVKSAKEYFDRMLSDAQVASLKDQGKTDGRISCTLSVTVRAGQIEDYCRRIGVTPGSFLQAAFAEALRRITREEKGMYATTSNGRLADTALQDCTGMFVKTLPMVTMESRGLTSGEYVKRFHKRLQECLALDYYPYTKIVEETGLKASILFSYQDGIGLGPDGAGNMSLALDAAKLPVLIEVFPEADHYTLSFEYDGRIYGKKEISIFANAIANMAENLAKAEYVRDAALISDGEKEKIMEVSTGECLDYNKEETVIDLFLRNVGKNPGNKAVVDEEGCYTYEELDRISDSIAAFLLRAGVKADDFVAIKMDRVKEYVAAVVGIQKAGACYVPVDPNYPQERIDYMLSDSESAAVLTEETVKEAAAEFPDAERINRAVPEGAAYMIYTSGSTGRPKGAIIPHYALMNYTLCYIRRFSITPKDRISHHITWSFDSHIRDLFPALGGGAGLYIMPESIRRDPEAIIRFLDQHKITGSAYATAMGQLLLQNYRMKQRFITLGGEALRAVKAEGVTVLNACGATEVTDAVVEYALADGVYYDAVPIGKPMPNCYAFIVDDCSQLMPLGLQGEICYAGPQVGLGYWRLPDVTAKVFTDCPFVKGERMYHSGDLGLYNEQGDMEYMGRIGTQVKLRGFRIELGEVESTALRHDAIKQAVAAVKTDQLVLYYVVAEGSVIKENELKDFLAESLTDYMVPSVYAQLEAMPMTPSGKIDRRKLPEPEVHTVMKEIKKPENELQSFITSAFAKALSLDEVGIDEDFFELGGSSLSAAKVMMAARVRELPIYYQDIFNAPTAILLEKLVREREAAEEPVKGKGSDYSNENSQTASGRTDPALQYNAPEYADEIRQGDIGDVLMVGATGFLGMHVLHELIEHTDSRIICLARDKDISATERLKQELFYYFEKDYVGLFADRIKTVTGDITDPSFIAAVRGEKFETVINCAASVKHFAKVDFLKKINTEGAGKLADLCIMKGTRLIHVSTYSVAGSILGEGAKDAVLYENTLNVGQEVESNGYIYTKYLAEELILKKIREEGLDAKIMRIGNLMSRYRDGEFQLNFHTNNFMRTLRAYVKLGAFPMSRMDEQTEFSPVDETARGILALAGTDSRFTLFHVYNANKVEMGIVIRVLRETGFRIDIVSDEEFDKRLKAALADEKRNESVSPLVNYELGDDDQRTFVPVDNRFTVKALYRTGFCWSITDYRYLRKTLEMLKQLDFFS